MLGFSKELFRIGVDSDEEIITLSRLNKKLEIDKTILETILDRGEARDISFKKIKEATKERNKNNNKKLFNPLIGLFFFLGNLYKPIANQKANKIKKEIKKNAQKTFERETK